jgi:hypothetical protein
MRFTRTRGDSPLCGTQFDPKIVEPFLSIPEVHWIELRESLDSPFRLTHLLGLSRSSTLQIFRNRNKVSDCYGGSLFSFHDPTSAGLANIKLFVGLTYPPTTSHSVRLPAARRDARVCLAVHA